MSKFKSFISMIWDTFAIPIRDLRVFGWILILAVIVFFTDPNGLLYLRTAVYVGFFWVVSLMIRKLIFPYRGTAIGKEIPLKLSAMVRAALYDGNIAAAIVAAAYIGFMVCVAYSFIYWVRG